MLVFFNEIMVLDTEPGDNIYTKIDSYSLILKEISDAKISNDDNVLAVATTSSSAPIISLYSTVDGFTEML
jgi:hypothetical protein